MTERRITLDSKPDLLKEVAGRVLKLSYRDLAAFADAIAAKFLTDTTLTDDDKRGMAEAALDAAEEISAGRKPSTLDIPKQSTAMPRGLR